VRYEVAFVDNEGRQRWRTTGTLREARLLRADLVSKVSRGERVAPSKLTVAAYSAEWLATLEGRLRPRSTALYEGHLRVHVLPRLGRRRLADVTVDDVASLLGELQREGLAPWSVRGVLAVLGRLLGSAERRGLIAANPVRRLERGERPRVERREFPALDAEAVGRLIAATPERYRVLVALSVLTGLRQGEALGLRWSDVDLGEGTVHVRFRLDRSGVLSVPKTEAARREIPFPPVLGRILAEHRLASPFSGEGDFVFCSETGAPLGRRAVVRGGLEPALAAAGLPYLRWHDLRHVAASLLIAQGASVGHVSRLLGHSSSASTLSTYAHAFAAAEHDEAMRERMEQAWSATSVCGSTGPPPATHDKCAGADQSRQRIGRRRRRG
jgi:integrase